MLDNYESIVQKTYQKSRKYLKMKLKIYNKNDKNKTNIMKNEN